MRALTTALALALLLCACGGGGEDLTLAAATGAACTATVITEASNTYPSIRCPDGERITTTPVVCTGSDACR